MHLIKLIMTKSITFTPIQLLNHSVSNIMTFTFLDRNFKTISSKPIHFCIGKIVGSCIGQYFICLIANLLLLRFFIRAKALRLFFKPVAFECFKSKNCIIYANWIPWNGNAHSRLIILSNGFLCSIDVVFIFTEDIDSYPLITIRQPDCLQAFMFKSSEER